MLFVFGLSQYMPSTFFNQPDSPLLSYLMVLGGLEIVSL